MLVVLFIIGLMAAVVLPSIVGLFTAGSDAQAYNLLAGQLAAARMVAIQNHTYAGVHVQLVDTGGTYNKKLTNTFFSAIVWDDPNTADSYFTLAEGFTPQKLPGSMAFGRVVLSFVLVGTYSPIVDTQKKLFTSLTFVFAPNGQLENGKIITFDGTTAGFADPNSRAYLWNPSDANTSLYNVRLSVKATVLFDYAKFLAAPSPTAKRNYLIKYGQIVVVDLYTGTLMGR
jgi:Tfp pilus assembly protein FimT